MGHPCDEGVFVTRRSASVATVAWSWVRFEELRPAVLYEILAMREAVFVVEQQCAYQELDGRDEDAWHLLGRAGDVLVAYARLLPPGARFSGPSIGRVLVAAPHRSQGLGHAVMREALAKARRMYPGLPICIAAQAHLQAFYEGLGFVVTSTPYDEDGIAHVDMRWMPPPGDRGA